MLPESQNPAGFSVFLNNGNGTTGGFFASTPATTFRPQNTTYFAAGASFALADLDGDGRVDLVVLLPEGVTPRGSRSS